MVSGGIGLTEQLNPEQPMLGYTDKSTVKLDFDDVPFRIVKYWALRTMKWFRLRGFVILKSSKNHYHVLFDNTVSWKKNVHIMGWVSLESTNEGLRKWFIMQCIKESSTLRVSPKRGKLSPRIILRLGKQDNEIRNFLRYRKFIKKI